MKKYIFIPISILVLLCVTLVISCKKDKDQDKSQYVPGQRVHNEEDTCENPEGTFEGMLISESTSIDDPLPFDGYIRWTAPDNFYLYAHHPYSLSICDVGEVNSLGCIKIIPDTGFISPRQSNTGVACKTGHGYVIKSESDGADPIYLRLYVVKPSVNGFGEITGKEVKYQYPFVPDSITVSADTLFFNKKDGKQEMVKVTTEATAWTIDNGYDSWIGCTRMGKNGLIVWVDENLGDERIGTIILKVAGIKAKVIYIKQASGNYKKGDFYSENGVEGIVYKTSPDGRNGMIVSMSETTCQWSSENKSTGCSSNNNGIQNMASIQNFSGWESKYSAFKWCYDFNKNVQGWYLPAIDELRDIHDVKNLVNQVLRDRNRTEIDGTCWSSTEANENAAKYFDFSTGKSYNPQRNKGTSHKVRAVYKI